eukprot:6345563-Amphidinium_carterae.1
MRALAYASREMRGRLRSCKRSCACIVSGTKLHEDNTNDRLSKALSLQAVQVLWHVLQEGTIMSG